MNKKFPQRQGRNFSPIHSGREQCALTRHAQAFSPLQGKGKHFLFCALLFVFGPHPSRGYSWVWCSRDIQCWNGTGPPKCNLRCHPSPVSVYSLCILFLSFLVFLFKPLAPLCCDVLTSPHLRPKLTQGNHQSYIWSGGKMKILDPDSKSKLSTLSALTH